MDRLGIINYFIKKNNYKSYIEIGVFTGYTLDGCIAEEKVGIDPQCQHYNGKNQVICTTSDNFFNTLDPNVKFDICFVDGLHQSDQVLRDVENSLKHLNPGGMIVMHDCNPPKYEHTTTGIDGCWTGDTYKTAVNMRMRFPYNFYVIDTDWGVGVFEKAGYIDASLPANQCYGYSYNHEINDLKWDNFDKRRSQLLNLISVKEFEEREK